MVAIVQARRGSSRLPGKVLEDVAGRPLLARVLERVQASAVVDAVVVATTTEASDDAVVELARDCGAETYRGSIDDVLDRFHGAAAAAGADGVVRVTADDPFKDPEVIDLVAGRLTSDPALDYVSNTLTPTYPEGLDIECFTAAALERAWNEARLPSEREHVTPYIWNHPERFAVRNVNLDRDLSHLRWTVDYPDDLEFARAVYERLADRPNFSMDDILELLEREPALTEINAGHVRMAGYHRSLAADEQEDQ
jgi:spore coat polysaccharide biosynthesis protein SpsF